MKLLVYSSKEFEIPYIRAANSFGYEVVFTRDRLTTNTAMKALGFKAVSIFSADDASTNVLEKLHDFGVEFIFSRSTGYDNIHLGSAKEFGIRVAYARAFSPHAVAEHAVGLALALNRHIVEASRRIDRHDFTLKGLIGTNLAGKKAGVLGTGAIGSALLRILHGFGCQILASDKSPRKELETLYDMVYLDKAEVITQSDLVFICLPLNEETHLLFDQSVVATMKPGALLINVARGAIVDAQAILNALDKGTITGYATDVFDREGGLFYREHGEGQLKDDLLKRLITHPKVLLTPHLAFATHEGLVAIATMLFGALECWRSGKRCPNEL
jgi:D-lactate dehydrogenase